MDAPVDAPAMVDAAMVGAAAVLVRVQGPDPKGTKRNDQSFSLFDAGITTLSASGTILQVGDRLVVVTSAHVLRPFLTKKNKCATHGRCIYTYISSSLASPDALSCTNCAAFTAPCAACVCAQA